jgi:hypothetical protein
MTTLLTFVNSGPVIRIPKALALRAAVPVLAVTLAACGMLMFGGEPAAPAPGTGVQAERPMVAIFTGEFVDGMPVYRLPSITVTARRGAEVPAMRQDNP